MNDIFDLAFFIDQGVNINRQPIEEAVEDAVTLFLQLYPEWNHKTKEELKVMGMEEFKSWSSKEGSLFLRKEKSNSR